MGRSLQHEEKGHAKAQSGEQASTLIARKKSISLAGAQDVA